MKARRKKTKKGTTTESITTPRTKAAVAREAAEKTRKEAMEAELKAAAAREAAARQEAMAARLEFSATQAEASPHKREIKCDTNISPRRLMPHLLQQMVHYRTNLRGGHSIQMIIISNQATT